MNYQTITEHDLGRGIDVRSSENLLAPGFFQDILNGDVLERRVIKRVGYQQHCGYVPVRATQLTYTSDTEDNIRIDLDSSISLSNLSDIPVLIQGRTSKANTSDVGSFPTVADGFEYFTKFSADPRRAFTSPGGSVISDQASHGLDSSLLFVGVTESLSSTDFTNQVIIPDQIRINKADLSVSVDHTNSSDFEGFIYFSEKSAVGGETFVAADTIVAPQDTQVITISATEHALASFNIITRTFQNTASEFIQVIPDLVIVDPTTGEVSITITNSSSDPLAFFPVLTVAPLNNIRTGAVANGSSTSVTIPGFSQDIFPFLGIYLEQTIGGLLEEVLPDTIVYDDSTGNLDITFTNNSGSSANFEIYYDSGEIITNQLFVTGEVIDEADTFVDTNPQITVWGICHEDIYVDSDQRQGWVNHIDTYRRNGEERIITGLGGNLFSARLSTEAVGLPTVFPRLNNRVSSDVTVGPLFHGTDVLVGRTRGYVTSTTSVDNWAEISSVSLNETTGYAEYLLDMPGLLVLDSEGNPTDIMTVLNTVAGIEDILTVRDMGWAIHNGDFRIVSADIIDTNTLRIAVDNPRFTCNDYNEVDAGGLAGVFTDHIELINTSEFVFGDRLVSELFGEVLIIKAIGSEANTVVFTGIVDIVNVPTGLRITGERTSRIIPTRNSRGLATVENIVLGDMLDNSTIQRQLRVVNINTQENREINILGDGLVAHLTLSNATTTDLTVGQYIFLTQAGEFSGEHKIVRIIDSSSFEVESTVVGTQVGHLLGKYVEIDESLSFEDRSDNSLSLTVFCRWFPIEAPADDFECTNNSVARHLDVDSYVDQSFVRSTMVRDNMYFVNGSDEVMKFDGENVYRAGLFRWQPGLFVTLDNTNPGRIVTNTPQVSVNTIEENQFLVNIGDESKYLVGDRVRHNDGTVTEDFVITNTEDDGRITVNRDVTTVTPGSLTRISTYRYYFRLNAVDANSNIVASAVTGAENFRVDVGEDTAIQLKLVGMPAWHIYDYDRLEVEIYRTVADTELPFYRITNIPMQFNKDDGYITFVDTNQDEELQSQPFDALSGVAFDLNDRINISEPLRAKYITSSDNRLILANLRDYPQLDIQLHDQASIASNADLDGLFWSFRRNSLENEDITSTDMNNTVRYQWVDGDTASVLSLASTTFDSESQVTLDVGAPLPVGGWIYVYHSSKLPTNNVQLIGWHQIVASAGSTVTINYKNTGIAPSADSVVTALNPRDVPVLLGTDGNRDTRTDANSAILRSISSATTRLAEAINTTMRVTQTEGFTPWMIANAGDEFSSGQLIVRQPRVESVTPEMQIDSNLPAAVDVFINDLRRAAGSQATMTERIYPSRIIQSYPNFPEMFDTPNTISDVTVENVRDINSADGQELTGIIPFFADSTTSDSTNESIIVAFKSNSIYVYNVANISTEAQRLETQGMGCTAPFSISPSKDGIIFANNSGIYSITRSLNFRYIGRAMDRNWLESVNEDQIELVQGHNFARNRQYKLSVPVNQDKANSQVYVYDHTRETLETAGGWTRYDNHPATGWANSQSDAFFGSTLGRVFSIRRTGTESDFRDDSVAIDWKVKYRAMDFGDAAARKTLISIMSHFRNLVNSDGTTLRVATELNRSFEDTDSFRLIGDENDSGIHDRAGRAVVSLRSSVNRRKFVYLQVMYENSELDEPVELAGIDFRATLTSRKGTQEASDT